MEISPTELHSEPARRTPSFDGLRLAETAYSRAFVDWHAHENPHFTLITHGGLRHGTRRETYDCPIDTLLFHNREEPHSNALPRGLARGFQLEIRPEWSRRFDVDLDELPAAARIAHPGIKLRFHEIYRETRLLDDASPLTVDALLVDMVAMLRGIARTAHAARPGWVRRAEELLRERHDHPLSLQDLARELDLHWAHLSREFPRYFHCNFGEYLRRIRIEKSLALLRDDRLRLADVALQSGFADQSHFNRCFREYIGLTPRAYRKLFQ